MALGLLLVPLVGYAAYDDVSMTSDTVITVSGVNLSVVAPTAVLQSIVVHGSSLDVVMPGNSFLKLTSTDRRLFSATNFSPVTETKSCTDSASTYTYESPAEASAIAFTITIESSTCTTGAAGGGGSPGGGGGGGGGGASSGPPPRTQKVYPDGTKVYLDEPGAAAKIKELDAKFAKPATVAAAAAALPGAPAAPGVSAAPALSPIQIDSILGLLASFSADASVIADVRAALSAPTVSAPAAAVVTGTISRALKQGTTHTDVKTLQSILNSDPDTQVASSGTGSPGSETNYFGPATRRAVQKFQEKHNIAKPGDEGYGSVGPKTRAKLNDLAGSATPAIPAAPGTPAVPATPAIPASVSIISFTKPLKAGARNDEVRALQQVLNADPDTRISATGDGSPGSETTFFGAATRRAVQKFQEKYGLAGPGDEGYGSVGPKTRAKLNDLLSAGTPEAQLQSEIDASRQQIQQLEGQLQGGQ